MGFGQFSAVFTALMLVAGTATAASGVSLNGTPRITPLQQHKFDRWAGIPAQILLSGHIVDDEGNRVRGVEILLVGDKGTRVLTKSGKDGAFDIDELLPPEARLVLRHKMFAPRRIQAGVAYSGDNEPASIEIIPYTERFDITPQGGVYKSGQLTLDVPPGAIDRPVTILAAQLPLDFGYNHDGTIEPLRLTSVDLKPHGFRFSKPVTLTMTIDREDIEVVTNPVSFYFNEDEGRYVHDPAGQVEIDGHRASLTLSHFSHHAIADGRLAQSIQNLGRGTDVDGDGNGSPSDALFILLASGGKQDATANYAQTVGGSVLEEDNNMRGVGDRFEIKGHTYSLSPPLNRTAARRIAAAFSLGQQWEQPITASLVVEADEYGFDCKLLLGIYDFHRGTRWRRVTPTSAEMSVIEAAWKTAQAQHKADAPVENLEFFQWQGTDKHIVAQNLPGIHTLAVTAQDNTLDVFVQGRSYLLAKIRGATSSPCPGQTEADLWASSDKAISGVRGRKAQQVAMTQNFFFGHRSKTPQIKASWGTLQRDAIQTFTDLKCTGRRHEVWNYAINHNSDHHDDVRMWTTTSIQNIVPGEAAETSVEWSITNDTRGYLSEHLTAGLFKQSPDGAIPFGFMLHKTAERPCEAAPALHSEKDLSHGSSVTALMVDPTYGLSSRKN